MAPTSPTSTLLEKDDITPFFSGQKRPNIPAPLSSTSRVRMEAGILSSKQSIFNGCFSWINFQI